MVANILPLDPPDPGDGINKSKFTFFEHGHVAYQIKENHECSNMVAHFCLQTPYPPTRICEWGQ